MEVYSTVHANPFILSIIYVYPAKPNGGVSQNQNPSDAFCEFCGTFTDLSFNFAVNEFEQKFPQPNLEFRETRRCCFLFFLDAALFAF